jgi:hypothetical protein
MTRKECGCDKIQESGKIQESSKIQEGDKKQESRRNRPQKNKSQIMHHAGKRVWLQQNIRKRTQTNQRQIFML